MEILDLSWKAKVAADWIQWWEHHCPEFILLRTRSRNVAEPPSPSTERQSRSRSASTSVTRQSNRSATPKGTPAVVSHQHGVDEQVEDRSATWKRKLSRRWRNSKSTCSNASRTTLNQRVRRPWYPLTVMTVTIWNHTSHGHPGLTLLSLWKWHAASDARLLWTTRVSRVRTGGWAPYRKKPGRTKPPCCTTLGDGSTRVNKGECHRSSTTVRSTNGERPFWLSQAIEFTSCSATIQCRRLSLD